MSPEAAIAMLDRQLARHGQAATLRRLMPGPGATMVPLEVTCRAAVRTGGASDQEGFAAQAVETVVLSPTEMQARQWCWPPIAGDRVVIAGYEHAVRVVKPFEIDDRLVRLELGVIGPHGKVS